MTTKPVRKHYDWTRATMAHCGCGKWELTVIFDCEPTCAACIDAHYTSALENHINAQTALIAEQQAVIDQRNGECDRLIKELAALRDQNEQRKPFGWLRVVSGSSFQIMEGSQRPPDRSGDCVGPWFAVYTQPAPVAVPNAIRVQKALLWLDVIMMKHPGMKEPITCAEVLRLNSRSKGDE